MATDTRQSSTFACAFCDYEDIPRLLKPHMINEHAVEIASRHWATHTHRIRSIEEVSGR
jgi:hypothetical protein